MISNISKDDQGTLLEAFKQYLYAEDTSRHTTSAYLSDLSHFLNSDPSSLTLLARYVAVEPSQKVKSKVSVKLSQQGKNSVVQVTQQLF